MQINTELQIMKTSVKEEDRTSTVFKSIALHIEFKSWPSHLNLQIFNLNVLRFLTCET